jgi:hypothetical protein
MLSALVMPLLFSTNCGGAHFEGARDRSRERRRLEASPPLRSKPDAPGGVDKTRLCPYSDETVAGCPNYRPASEHGDFPEAAECRCLLVVQVSSYQRRRTCRRVTGNADS